MISHSRPSRAPGLSACWIDAPILVACGERGSALLFRSDLMERRAIVPDYAGAARVVAVAFSDRYRE